MSEKTNSSQNQFEELYQKIVNSNQDDGRTALYYAMNDEWQQGYDMALSHQGIEKDWALKR